MSTTPSFEQQMFKAADKLRKNMDAAEYKYVVLWLIFLKYISDSFQELHDRLSQEKYSDPEDRDEYIAENVFFVPEEARRSTIQSKAKLPSIGTDLDKAMQAIESENKALKNVLPQVYAKPNLDKASLWELIDLISNTDLKLEDENSKDLFWRVYEYFLWEFANKEWKKWGQFYTPKSIVSLMVEMIEPYSGRVFDPASGSGGMFVMSEQFVTNHAGQLKDITIYGQESNQTTWKLSKMNLAIRNINSSFVKRNTEWSFLRDAHPDLKADYVLANPPFNQSDRWQDKLADDARRKYGLPPANNANFARIQHMLYHLASDGVMASVLANGSLSSQTAWEWDIRQRLIEEDLVDCIVALPKQLFYNTGIPACIWFLRRSKKHNAWQVLFIDATEHGFMADRTHREFSDEDIASIAQTYHNRKTGESYQDEIWYCKSASREEIEQHNFVLTPGRYVGIKPPEDDGIPFEDKMTDLTATLRHQFQQEAVLNEEIKTQLEKIGFKL